MPTPTWLTELLVGLGEEKLAHTILCGALCVAELTTQERDFAGVTAAFAVYGKKTARKPRRKKS